MNAARNYKDDFARRYFVLRFDCSGLSSSDVQENFLAAVRGAAFDFTGRHGFDDAARFIDREYANPTALIIDLLAKPHPHTKGVFSSSLTSTTCSPMRSFLAILNNSGKSPPSPDS